jgi:hypothetical protein
LEYDRGRSPSTKKWYPDPIIQVCHFCANGFLGRIRETKITDTELSWLYSALIARQPIDPTHLLSTSGVVSNIEFGRYWFGVLPLYVGYLFETGYYKEPEASPTRDFPRI